MIGFETAVGESLLMLTDGGIETDVLLPEYVPLPEYVQVAALVDDPAGGPVLRRIYVSYVAAAHPFGLLVIIGKPTFRASLNFVRRAGLGDAVLPGCRGGSRRWRWAKLACRTWSASC
jgi:hypothetical protein